MLNAACCTTEDQACVAFDTKASVYGVNKRAFESIRHTIGARRAFAAQAVTRSRIDGCLVAEIQSQIALNIDAWFRHVLTGDRFAQSARSIQRCLMASPIGFCIEAQRRFREDGARTG